VYARGYGIVVSEPSIVALNKVTGKIEAVGTEAKEMLGRTPGNITAIKPMKDGVIADFEAAEKMLTHFIRKAHKRSGWLRPRVVIGVPSEITQVERRAVKDSAMRAKASEVHLIEEAMAAAIGAGMPITEASGNMVVDIGGGTTDIAVYANGGIVHSATIPVGGNILTNDIALGLKTTFAEADNVKRTFGSGLLRADEPELSFHVKTLDGRNTRDVTSSHLRAIVVPRVLEIFRLAKANVVDHIPRDQVLSELVITGGGARLRGIETTAADVFGLPVRIGVPATIAGLTDAVKQPEYATAVGLVLFGPRGEQAPHLGGQGGGPFARLWNWFTSIWN
jgi:rod shape-determining protein MreB